MTREEALLEASKWGLELEVEKMMDEYDCSPSEALMEWDIYMDY